MDKELESIVLENGSVTTKAGFSGGKTCRYVFPSVVSHTTQSSAEGITCSYVGDQAFSKRHEFELRHPVRNNEIIDWDDMESLWSHLFNFEIRIDSEAHPILFAEKSLTSKYTREHIVEVMFEKFKIPAIYFANQAVLALFASGRLSGMVADCGEIASYIVPVYEGEYLRYAIEKLNIGGRDITECLSRYLHVNTDFYGVKNIKERLCYVALDSNPSLPEKEFYTLPDGTVITLGDEKFTAPECLFKPCLVNKEDLGMHEGMLSSMSKCPVEFHPVLNENIIMSGGNTMFRNIAQRTLFELQSQLPHSKVKVIAPPERIKSVWLGGSVLASLLEDVYPHVWISRDDYTEYGHSIVHKKCF